MIHEYEYYTLGAPLGESLVQYYNYRAVAYLRNEIFVTNAPFLRGLLS